MKILVIGGTGFIGPHVVRKLVSDGHRVAVFHRGGHAVQLPEDVQEIKGDRRDLAAHEAVFDAFAPEVVLDVILSSGRQAAALMDLFRGRAGRAVAVSSMDAYRACGVLHGSEPGDIEPLPLTEDSPVRTVLRTYPPASIKTLQSVFGWLDDEYDKIPVERAVLGDPRLPGTVLRLPMVYGPGDPLHRFFPLLKRIDDGRPAILFAEDFAEWRGSKGYVENVAAAIALAVVSEKAAGRIYNVAEPEAPTEREWAERVAKATGWPGRIVILPRERTPKHLILPGNTRQHWVASSQRIREELGYREPVAPDEALRRTIEWERTHPPTVDPAQFDYAAEDAALSA
ncbi:MAG TPA: NAD-dependent epimerase/dehydratase family protein [Vicinamibacteria bacterium]|jgi:nucleoside-diphosphate-sugar epimerase